MWKWVIYLCAETKSAHFSSMIFGGGENVFVILVYKLRRTYNVVWDQNVLKLNIYSMASGQISNRIDTCMPRIDTNVICF